MWNEVSSRGVGEMNFRLLHTMVAGGLFLQEFMCTVAQVSVIGHSS